MGQSVMAAALLAMALSAGGPPAHAGGGEKRPRSADPVGDATAAEARYRAFHREAIAPHLGEGDRRRAEGLLERRPAAELSSCRGALGAIADPGKPGTLHGSPDALDRAGECWVLRWDGLLGLGLGAVVARDGEVLLSWWIPEG